MRIAIQFRIIVLSAVSVFLFSCSSNYKLINARRVLYPISPSLAADSTIIKTYLPYKLKMDAQMNAVIGYSAIALTKTSVGGESLLGNFFSDAALHEARKTYPDIDFAMPSTNGGLRNDLPLGAITLANVFELMPFENELIVFELNGSSVQSLMNMIAKSKGQPVSGITIKITDRKPVEVFINGKPFDPSKSYRVLTSDYIAGGGDDVNSFKNPVKSTIVGLKVRDALIQYIKEQQASGKKINSILDRRVTND